MKRDDVVIGTGQGPLSLSWAHGNGQNQSSHPHLAQRSCREHRRLAGLDTSIDDQHATASAIGIRPDHRGITACDGQDDAVAFHLLRHDTGDRRRCLTEGEDEIDPSVNTHGHDCCEFTRRVFEINEALRCSHDASVM